MDARLPWFVDRYEAERKRLAPLDRRKRRDAISENEIKLTRALKNDLVANVHYQYDGFRNRASLYRPYVMKRLHYWSRLNEMQYKLNEVFCGSESNQSILLSGHPAQKPFQTLATDTPHSYHTLEDTESLPRFRYAKSGERVDNITDWAVAQFVGHYISPSPEGEGLKRNSSPKRKDLITKDAIFAYCYAVLHDPVYREKYALNLKREFPRIPFYPDFARWVSWGEALLKLHIGYEDVKPAKLKRVDTPAPKRAKGTHPKPKLKSEAGKGVIVIDEDTQLSGVPLEAWGYRLGNRSAIDWVLDQHKEKTPRDPTIRAKFNTYRFADYKEVCITLLGKVVHVSVETVAITKAMAALDRTGWG